MPTAPTCHACGGTLGNHKLQCPRMDQRLVPRWLWVLVIVTLLSWAAAVMVRVA